MSDIILYSLWIVSAIASLAVYLRVFVKERHNPTTDLTNGMMLAIMAISVLPFMNVMVAVMLIDTFPKYFCSLRKPWWLRRSIYKSSERDPNE